MNAKKSVTTKSLTVKNGAKTMLEKKKMFLVYLVYLYN